MKKFLCRLWSILRITLYVILFLYVIYLNIGFKAITKSFVKSHYVISDEYEVEEKRGTPAYDYVIGKDNLPHFRVFFWVPKSAKNYSPYADAGIKTDVLGHASVEKWGVSESNTYRDDEKLVYIWVPKRFVLCYGSGFEKVIHLHYEILQNE